MPAASGPLFSFILDVSGGSLSQDSLSLSQFLSLFISPLCVCVRDTILLPLFFPRSFTNPTGVLHPVPLLAHRWRTRGRFLNGRGGRTTQPLASGAFFFCSRMCACRRGRKEFLDDDHFCQLTPFVMFFPPVSLRYLFITRRML